MTVFISDDSPSLIDPHMIHSTWFVINKLHHTIRRRKPTTHLRPSGVCAWSTAASSSHWVQLPASYMRDCLLWYRRVSLRSSPIQPSLASGPRLYLALRGLQGKKQFGDNSSLWWSPRWCNEAFSMVRLDHRSAVVAKYNAVDTSLATFLQHSS